MTLHNPGLDEVRVWVVASGIHHTDLGYLQYTRACPVIRMYNPTKINASTRAVATLFALENNLLA